MRAAGECRAPTAEGAQWQRHGPLQWVANRCRQTYAERTAHSCNRSSSLTGMDGDYTPREVSELLSSGSEVQLIDVRQQHEHDAGRIQGDRLIELMQLTAQAD